MRERLVPAEREHVLRVLSNPSNQTVKDIRVLGLSPADAIGFFLRRVPENDAVAIYDGDALRGVLGFDKAGDDWYSWFICTPEFYEPKVGNLLASRRIYTAIQRRNPWANLFVLLLVNTPKIRKWLLSIGFSTVETARNGALYRFTGRRRR